MVHGNAGSVTAKLITDDNHLPTATSNYKLRLINGLTGAAQPLTMDVNFGNVASNIQPGAASAYAVLGQSVATQISVTSPSSLDSDLSGSAEHHGRDRGRRRSSPCSCSAMRARRPACCAGTAEARGCGRSPRREGVGGRLTTSVRLGKGRQRPHARVLN